MNLIQEKEYALYGDINDNKRTSIDDLISQSSKLQLNTYQTFVTKFMNPITMHTALLLIHGTGTGKTISALAAANEFIKQYRKSNLKKGNICIVGFTKEIFKNELVMHPDFGFINQEELDEYNKYIKHAHESSTYLDKAKNLKQKYIRRLVNDNYGGIFLFLGFRQLTLRVINNSEKLADATNLEDVIKKINDGEISINYEFIKTLHHTLFIVDECHNIYLGSELNTYGISLYFIKKYFEKLPEGDPNFNSARFLYLSATPFTSSALECIPLCQLITGKHYKPSQIFDTSTEYNELSVKGENILRQTFAGYVSYVMDDNPLQYASSAFEGSEVSKIPYLKFNLVKPLPKQFDVKIQSTSDTDDEKGQIITKDMVFYLKNGSQIKNGKEITLYKEELSLNKIDSINDVPLWTGNILEQPQLSKISPKYDLLVNLCKQYKGVKNGKIFIYHPWIQSSGVSMIISILRSNGFLYLDEPVFKTSICMHCDNNYVNHNKITEHDFTPVRITSITGIISKVEMANRLSIYNSNNNLYGEQMKIIVGSRIMRESHTLKACKNVWICHEPSSISEMIQIIGRAVRKNVHNMLPIADRSVGIKILAHNHPIELNVYKFKMMKHIQVMRVEDILENVSVDYLINMRFKNKQQGSELFSLDTKKKETKSITQIGIHTNRQYVFYFEEEIRICIMIIKRILLEWQPVIKISQLFKMIKSPPFYIECNTTLLSDEAISIALITIIKTTDDNRIFTEKAKLTTVDTLYLPTINIIDQYGNEYNIECRGNPLCGDSFIYRSNIYDSRLCSAFDIPSIKTSNDFDMRKFYDEWNLHVDLEQLVLDLSKLDKSKLVKKIISLTKETIIQLLDLCIQECAEFAILNKKTNISPEFVLEIISLFKDDGFIITLDSLLETKIASNYKSLNKSLGIKWESAFINNKPTKVSTTNLPIGHIYNYPEFRIMTKHNNNLIWENIHEIYKTKTYKLAFDFFLFEIKNGLYDTTYKYKNVKDTKSLGVNLKFMQLSDLKIIGSKITGKDFKLDKKLKMIGNIIKYAFENDKDNKKIIFRFTEEYELI